MNKKVRIILLATLIIIIVFYKFYTFNFTNQGIFNKVTNRDGYSLTILKEQVPIELYIKPEWIAFTQDERKDLNLNLLEMKNSNILLDNVLNRGNDIYFSFHTSLHMKYKHGEFLYNGVFNEDGTFTSPSSGKITLFDHDHNKIPVGQHGHGPGADFSFGIEPAYQNLIQNGFYVKYTGFILYDYSRK